MKEQVRSCVWFELRECELPWWQHPVHRVLLEELETSSSVEDSSQRCIMQLCDAIWVVEIFQDCQKCCVNTMIERPIVV